METRENAEFCPALYQGSLAPLPQCPAARDVAGEAPQVSSQVGIPERQECETKISPQSWSSPRDTSFWCLPNAGVAAGASDSPFPLPTARHERICSCKEPPSDISAWDGQALLFKLFINYLSKLLLSSGSSGFLVADGFCIITTYLLCCGWQVARCKHPLCLISCLPIMRGSNGFALKPGSSLSQVTRNTVATRVVLFADLV